MQDIHAVLDARAVTPVFQPRVDIASGQVLGYEALSRGPAGTPWETPAALFAAARAAGRERTEDRARDAYEADDGLQKRTAEVYAELAAAAWLSPWSTVDDTTDPRALAARILR